MTLSLTIIINVLADFALIGGLAYVMSRTTRLTPHAPATDRPAPAAVRVRQRVSAWRAQRLNAARLPVHS